MIRILPLAAAALAVATAMPAHADKGGNKNRKHDRHASAGFCPPGLAKKDPACVPPGQAKKHAREWRDDHDRDHDRDHDWRDADRRDDWRRDDDWRRHSDWDRYIRVGDRIDDRFVRVTDPYRYGLNPDYYYYRAIDRIFRVDPQTRQVLSFIGLVDALTN